MISRTRIGVVAAVAACAIVAALRSYFEEPTPNATILVVGPGVSIVGLLSYGKPRRFKLKGSAYEAVIDAEGPFVVELASAAGERWTADCPYHALYGDQHYRVQVGVAGTGCSWVTCTECLPKLSA